MDMEEDEALARVRAARVGRLATVTPDGLPHVVPFVFAVVGGGAVGHGIGDGNKVTAYWVVDDKPKRTSNIQRLRNIERNPVVVFVVDEYDDDWERLWWVRCSGSARIVDDVVERRAALEALGAKYPPYEADPPSGRVVAIDIERITGWRASETSA